MLRTFACVLLIPCALPAQELRILPVVASRGEPARVSIALVSRAERPVTALQWELLFLTAQIRIQDGDWEASKEVIASGKTLACVRQLRPDSGGFAYRCILAGGAKAVPNGPVAVVKVVVLDAPGPKGPILRLENIVAVSVAAKRTALRPTQATITVR